jgi:FKBP-type peptidyl-prolyl cis-trans isomerase
MTTKTPQPDVRTKLPSPPAMAAIIGSALCLLLTVWIFVPGGFLDTLTAPGEVEATDLIINEQEHDVAADLTPEKNAAFLADNAKKEGVTTTATGLQYRKISGGGGKKPASSRSKVTVHYTGALINGKVFDSSVSRGEPITFGLNQVIPGWTEGLQLMSEGEKAELVIPQDLGYGARGSSGAIPPLQSLVFQVELIKVQD